MRFANSKWLTVLILAAFVAGCATTPIDTMNKRIATVEITYSNMLDLAILYQKEGRLTLNEQQTLAKAFDDYETSRMIMLQALKAGDIQVAENKLLAMSQILDFVRPILSKEAK